jgi:FtsP/CotA-like multicopper oxidase with cupredoxin domain
MGAMDMDHDMAETDAMDMNMDHGDGGMGGMNHVNDVEYDAYLANDRTLADPEVVRVDPGGQIRLRLINAAAATNYLIDLGVLDGELIAVDGNAIAPLKRSTIELAIAQRADIRLRLPTGQGAYPILARREDGIQQTGIVLATRDCKIDRLPDHTDAKTPVFDLTLEEQLVALSPLAARAAERTHTLDMTGRHDGYHWGINGKVFNPDDPIHVTEGERVELVLRNDTNMHHPIHLHGHHFQVVAVDGRRFSGAVRDTVLVPPSRTVTVAFDADNPGHWALHCHQLYHMAAGMMTSVLYEGYQKT